MPSLPSPYLPVEGQTYTLFGNQTDTHPYYALIGKLADDCIARYGFEKIRLVDLGFNYMIQFIKTDVKKFEFNRFTCKETHNAASASQKRDLDGCQEFSVG